MTSKQTTAYRQKKLLQTYVPVTIVGDGSIFQYLDYTSSVMTEMLHCYFICFCIFTNLSVHLLHCVFFLYIIPLN